MKAFLKKLTLSIKDTAVRKVAWQSSFAAFFLFMLFAAIVTPIVYHKPTIITFFQTAQCFSLFWVVLLIWVFAESVIEGLKEIRNQ